MARATDVGSHQTLRICGLSRALAGVGYSKSENSILKTPSCRGMGGAIIGLLAQMPVRCQRLHSGRFPIRSLPLCPQTR